MFKLMPMFRQLLENDSAQQLAMNMIRAIPPKVDERAAFGQQSQLPP